MRQVLAHPAHMMNQLVSQYHERKHAHDTLIHMWSPSGLWDRHVLLNGIHGQHQRVPHLNNGMYTPIHTRFVLGVVMIQYDVG